MTDHYGMLSVLNDPCIYTQYIKKRNTYIFADSLSNFKDVHFKLAGCIDLGDNCIQNFYLGRYIVGYTVGNFVLRRRVSGAVKHNFRTYIRRYTSPNENFEYGYRHSNE